MPLNSEETGGRFRVWLYLDGKPPILAWDRKVEGGFPELKVLVSINGSPISLQPVPVEHICQQSNARSVGNHLILA